MMKYHDVTPCLALSFQLYSSCVLATISVDQPGERAVCFNGGIAIEFTHPTLGGDSGYLPNILWIRNGSDYVPDGLFEEVSITATKTILTITSGDDFPFGTTYQASIINQVTRGREFSEVVTIIAKGINSIIFHHVLSLLY